MQRRALSDSVKKPFKVHVRPATYQLDTKKPFLIWNSSFSRWDTASKDDLANVKKTGNRYNIVDTFKVMDYHTPDGSSRKIRVFDAIKFNPDGSEFEVQFAQFLPEEPPTPPSIKEIEEAARKQKKIEEEAAERQEEEAALERADLKKSEKPEPEKPAEPKKPAEPEPDEPEKPEEPEESDQGGGQDRQASSKSLVNIAYRIAFSL